MYRYKWIIYGVMNSTIGKMLAGNTHLLQRRAGSLDRNGPGLEQNTNTECYTLPRST